MEERRSAVQDSTGRALTRIGFVALLAATAPAAACEPALKGDGVSRIEGRDYVVAWRAEPAALRVSEFFAIAVAACAKSRAALPAQIRVDAVMPDHKHGMNYRPTVTRVSDGVFRAEGMLLHMPGVWEISFDVRGEGQSEVLRERFALR
jgi:hypothetical protein